MLQVLKLVVTGFVWVMETLESAGHGIRSWKSGKLCLLQNTK